jgi:hypothetical protein
MAPTTSTVTTVTFWPPIWKRVKFNTRCTNSMISVMLAPPGAWTSRRNAAGIKGVIVFSARSGLGIARVGQEAEGRQ